MSRRTWFELLRRVEEDGAVLYLSHDDCLLSPFNLPFGLEVQTREKRTAPADFILPTPAGGLHFTCTSPFKLNLRVTGADVLGSEPDGNPVFTCASHGKGKIYFSSVPVERYLSETPGAFTGDQAQPFWWFYQEIAAGLASDRIVTKDNVQVGITEHPLQPDQRVVVVINYSPTAQETALNWLPVGKFLRYIMERRRLVQPAGFLWKFLKIKPLSFWRSAEAGCVQDDEEER